MKNIKYSPSTIWKLKRLVKATNTTKAITYMGVYALTHSIAFTSVKLLSEDLSIQTLFFLRSLIGFAFALPLLIRYQLQILNTNHLSLHLLRTLVALVGGLSAFYALSKIPLSLFVSVTFSAPIIASIIAWTCLNETFTKQRLISVSLGFTGVLVLLRPSLNSDLLGVFAAIVAAIMTGVAFTTVKQLTSHDDSRTVAYLPFLLILPFTAIVAVNNWTSPTLEQVPLLLTLGISTVTSQYAMSKAFSLADASIVLPIDFTRIIITSVIGAIYFGNEIDGYVLVGGALILAGSIQPISVNKQSK